MLFQKANKLRRSATLGLVLVSLSPACGGAEASGAGEDTETATDTDPGNDTDTDTDGGAELPEPDFTIVLHKVRPGPAGDVAAATLLVSEEGVVRERNLGEDPLGGEDDWGSHSALISESGRWVVTVAYDDSLRRHVRVLEIFSPLDEREPVQVAEFEAPDGQISFLGSDTLLLTDATDDGAEGEISLLDLEGTLTPVSIGAVARDSRAYPVGDGEHFYYYGRESDGYNIMLGGLDPAVAPVAVTDIPEGYVPLIIFSDPENRTLLVDASSSDSERLYGFPGFAMPAGPGLLLGEVTGELDLAGISLSPDGQLYSATIFEPPIIGSPHPIDSRVGSTQSGANHAVGEPVPHKTVLLPDGLGYIHWSWSDTGPGLYLSNATGEHTTTLHDEYPTFVESCGDLIVTVGDGDEARAIRVFNHAGESVPVNGVDSVPKANSFEFWCSSTHAFVAAEGEGVLFGLDGASVAYAAAVDDLGWWYRVDGYAFTQHGEGSDSVLTMRTNTDPAPTVVAEGELLSVSVTE